MALATESQLASLWDPSAAPKDGLDELVYASNLLGSDLRITNFGGGNTSAKVSMPDPLSGEESEVLWVKGSGGDLGSAKSGGFASLYMDKLRALREKVKVEGIHEDDVVPLYSHCVFGLNPVACSIDTPLHAYVPYRAVSHMHSDAVIAIAASKDTEALTGEIWKGEMGFLPWKRPGFELGTMLANLVDANPGIKGALMASHGFICWADTWRECYETTLRMINQAQTFIDEHRGSGSPLGAEVRMRLQESEARAAWLELLPELRGAVAFEGQRLIADVDSSEPVLDFLGSAKLARLAGLGTSCPDHFLRTKIRPLVLDPLPHLVRDGGGGSGERSGLAELDAALEAYRAMYTAYYDRCKRQGSPAMRNPNPSVVLVPGLGMVSFGKNAQEAKVTGQFYRNAIEVMRDAEAVSEYVALAEREAFDIEYWQLEEAKLRRQPPEKDQSRRIAVVTGGAQGIGLASAKAFAASGSCVAILDIDEPKLVESLVEVQKASGVPGSAIALKCDVTDAAAVQRAFEETILAFGGVDVCVACAGNARRGTVAETSEADYDFQSDLLMKGYFLTLRAASQIMIRQGMGGSIVVVASKNGVAVGSNAAVYSAAKAFELHLMRTAASDLARHGIRCNAVNPDAVLEGSAIWSDQWRAQTAANLGISVDDLPEHYRKRSLLGVTVSTEDVARAVLWLASDAQSSRTTGCTIPVDGGVREGFLR